MQLCRSIQKYLQNYLIYGLYNYFNMLGFLVLRANEYLFIKFERNIAPGAIGM